MLCETPYYVPAGLIPSLEDIKSVEDHVKTMETEKVKLIQRAVCEDAL